MSTTNAGSAKWSYSARITHLPCDPNINALIALGDTPLYNAGHRDARHAAADIAAEADAEIARLRDERDKAVDLLRAIQTHRSACFIPNDRDGLREWDERCNAAIAKGEKQ